MRTARALLAVLAVAALLPLAPAGAQQGGGAVDPYVDPAQLADRPSFVLQPWRGWMETVPAARMLDGIGIQYRVPAGTDHDATIGVLADAGVRRLRVEVPWNDADPAGGLTADGRTRLAAVLEAAAAHDVAPLILLNAHSSEPTPYERAQVEVAADAEVGTRRVRLASVDGLVAGRSGFTGLAGDVMAEVLFTDVDEATATVTLGRPLPVDLDDGEVVTVDTLAYAPLHPVGTPEFDRTAAGWVDYVRAVLDEAERAGVEGTQVEVWNETAFASHFLDVGNYDDEHLEEGTAKFRPGGRAWELAARTVEMVEDEHPDVRVVWGYSNTNFYATAPTELPPGTDATSYHPYATGLVEVPAQFPDPSAVGAYDVVPDHLRVAVPEGRTALAMVPNPLTRRRLPPDRRDAAPPGTDDFRHVITEHGCTPREAGIVDAAQATHHKARCLLRYLPFWLNKGIAELYASRAWDADPLGRGLLSPSTSPAERGVDADDLVAEPVVALGNFTSAFEGAEDLDRVRQLGVEVAALGERRPVVLADDGSPALAEQDLLAVLPFQVTATRFAVPTYVLTYDLTTPTEPAPYRLRFTGVGDEDTEVRWYDPLTGDDEPVRDVEVVDGSVTVTVDVTDTARVLILDEDPQEDAGLPGWVVPAGVVALVVVGGVVVLLVLAAGRRTATAGPGPWPGEVGPGRGGRGRGRGAGRGGGGAGGRRRGRGRPF